MCRQGGTHGDKVVALRENPCESKLPWRHALLAGDLSGKFIVGKPSAWSKERKGRLTSRHRRVSGSVADQTYVRKHRLDTANRLTSLNASPCQRGLLLRKSPSSKSSTLLYAPVKKPSHPKRSSSATHSPTSNIHIFRNKKRTTPKRTIRHNRDSKLAAGIENTILPDIRCERRKLDLEGGDLGYSVGAADLVCGGFGDTEVFDFAFFLEFCELFPCFFDWDTTIDLELGSQSRLSGDVAEGEVQELWERRLTRCW